MLINDRFYVLLLALPLTGLLVFTVMPLLFMILIAFTNYDYAHMPPGKLFDWVGLANFKTMFSLSNGTSGFAFVFLRVLLWTFIWAFFATFTNYFLGLIVALLIHKKGIRLKALWRTLFVVAIAVPQFVTLLLMQKILDSDGILNKILGMNILWLTDQRYFSLLPRVMIILVNIWIGVPYTLLTGPPPVNSQITLKLLILPTNCVIKYGAVICIIYGNVISKKILDAPAPSIFAAS